MAHRYVRKEIKRATSESASAAMQKHIEKMIAKGWLVNGCYRDEDENWFSCIVWFSKEKT